MSMSGFSLWSFTLWCVVLTCLIRRSIHGPQRRFAICSMGLIWTGEALTALAPTLPQTELPGFIVELVGLLVAIAMVTVEHLWKIGKLRHPEHFPDKD